MINVIKEEKDYKKKTKGERELLKAIKANLTVRYQNKVIVHFGSDTTGFVGNEYIQPTKEQKRNRKHGTKKYH